MKKYLTSFVIAFLLCAFTTLGTACSCSGERVVEIYFERSSIDLINGSSIECTPEALGLVVLPANAKDKRVVFTVEQDKDASGKRKVVLNDSNRPTLTAVSEGIATITAKSLDGVKVASMKVRIFPQSYSLAVPKGIRVDNSNQAIVWDKEYITLGVNKLDEVFYQVKLNNQELTPNFENSFTGYEAGIMNTLQIKSVSVPAKDHIKASAYSGEVKFYVLPAPTNLKLNNGRLSWDEVAEADTYQVVVSKKNQNGEMERFKEFSGIEDTFYDLDLEEAGDFSVVVKASPSSTEQNKYTSRGSNEVTLTKYSEVSTLTIENDILSWNAVVGAEKYNIILHNKASNTNTTINIESPAVGQDIFNFDLSALSCCGDYTARIETISNPTLGLNSKVSELSVDFTKLPLPTFKGIKDNKLTWHTLPKGAKVQIFVGETDEGVFESEFTLPARFEAGEYEIFARAIGNGSNLVSSLKATESEKYLVGKLATPTSIENVGYEFSVTKIENAVTYAFLDTCTENSVLPAEITAKMLRETAEKATLMLTVPDKKTVQNEGLTFDDLYKNKFNLKVKAVGEEGGRYFDSEYSAKTELNPKGEITFHKMLPLTSVDGYFSTYSANEKVISLSDSYVADIAAMELNPLNADLIESAKSIGLFGEYFAKYLEVFRLTGPNDKEEQIFQKAMSVNETQLAITEQFEISGGKLILKMSFYGNNTTLLHGDGVIAKEKIGEFVTENDFIVWRVYEPINLRVTGTTLDFDLLEENRGGWDTYVLTNELNEQSYWQENSQKDLNELVNEPNIDYNFTIQNIINGRGGYWANSMIVPFTVGRLNAPVLEFEENGDISFSTVAEAREYIVWAIDNSNPQNTQGKIISAEEAESGKITFNYSSLFGANRIDGQVNIVVQASMGANSEVLLIDSKDSNALEIRDILLTNAKLLEGVLSVQANVNNSFDVIARLELIGEQGNQVLFEGNMTFEVDKFVLNLADKTTFEGKYNLTLWTEYTGEQTNPQLYYFGSRESQTYFMQELIYVPTSRELTFNEGAGEQTPAIISWQRVDRAKKYLILAKNKATNEVVTHEYLLNNANNLSEQYSFNLISFSGLETGVDYLIAVVAVGQNGGMIYINGPDNHLIEMSSGLLNRNFLNITFNTLPKYLEHYSGNSVAFSKVNETQNFVSAIEGNKLTLTWDTESNVEYEILKNNSVIATITSGTFEALIDTTNEKHTTWAVRGIFAQENNLAGNKVYASSLGEIKDVYVLDPVTDLTASGFLTFNHQNDDCDYRVEILDENDSNISVASLTTREKRIDLSVLTGLDVSHSFTIIVTAISDGVKYITSTSASISGITKTATPILYLDSVNKVFTTSDNGAYVQYLLAKYDEENVTFGEIKNSAILSASNSAFNPTALAGLESGKYKIWAVGMTGTNPTNEIFSEASNEMFFTLLKEVSGLTLSNGQISFMPAEGVNNYIISIDSTSIELYVSNTTQNYIYATDLLNASGEHNIIVTAKGNYLNPSSTDYSCTINSVSKELTCLKLSAPVVSLVDGNLTWSEVPNAQGYKIIFKASGKEDIVISGLAPTTLQYSIKNAGILDGTYSAYVVAVGNDQEGIINSALSGAVADIQIASTTELTISLSQANRRIEWTSASGVGVKYLLVFNQGENTEPIEIEVEDNFYSLIQNRASVLEAGQYTAFVKVKGNDNNILDGVPSNEITFNVQESVLGVYKSQTNEQIYAEKATINFTPIDGVDTYTILIIKPNSEVVETEYVFNAEELFEFTFDLVGDYFVAVMPRGDFVNTVDGYIASGSALELTKLATFNSITSIIEINEDYATTGMSTQKIYYTYNSLIPEDVALGIVFDNFLFSTYYDYSIDGYCILQNSAVWQQQFSTIAREMNNFRMLVKAPQGSKYLSSGWASVPLTIFKRPTINSIEGDRLYFSFNAGETAQSKEQIGYVSVEIYSLAETLLYAQLIEVQDTTTYVNIENILDSIPEGVFKAQIRILGNGEANAFSFASEQYSFTKLPAIVTTLKRVATGDNIGNFVLNWEPIPNATRYRICETFAFSTVENPISYLLNAENIIETTNCFYDVDARMDAIRENEELWYKDLKLIVTIRAVGDENFVSSAKTPEITLIQPKVSLMLELKNGTAYVTYISDEEPVLGEMPENNGAEFILNVGGTNYILKNGMLDNIANDFNSGLIKAKLKSKGLNEYVFDPNLTMTGTPSEIIVNSNFATEKIVFRVPDVAPIQVIDGFLYGTRLDIEGNGGRINKVAPLDSATMEGRYNPPEQEGGAPVLNYYQRIAEYVDVKWGDSVIRQLVQCDFEPVPAPLVPLPPEFILGVSPAAPNEVINVGYRVIGTHDKISGRYSSYSQDLRVQTLENPMLTMQNGIMTWNAVPNATGYKILFNARPQGEQENSAGAIGLNAYAGTNFEMLFDMATRQVNLGANVLSFNVEEYYNEYYSNLNKDCCITIVVMAVGSHTQNVDITYLTSTGSNLVTIKYAVPDKFAIKKGFIDYATNSARQEILVKQGASANGVVYSWSKVLTNKYESYGSIFSAVTSYRVQIRAVGDRVETFTSEWTDEFIIYKAETLASATIDDYGFLKFEINKTVGGTGLSLEDLISQEAIQTIAISVNGGALQYVSRYDLAIDEENENRAIGLMGKDSQIADYPNYGGEYLDFIPAGINTMNFIVIGNTTTEQNGYDKIINSANFVPLNGGSEKVFIKLATPQDIKIRNSILSWGSVDNSNGYIVQISGNNAFRTYITTETSLDLLNKEDNSRPTFPAGSYSISVRARGDANYLTSSSTKNVEFKVFKTPSVSIINGGILVSCEDDSTTKKIVGVHTTSTQTFPIVESHTVNENLFVEVPDYILGAENEKIYLQSGEYGIKALSQGDGETTIDSAYTDVLLGNKLDKVAPLTSENGKIKWQAVQSNSAGTILDYMICVTQGTQTATAKVRMPVAQSYFAIDLPMEFVAFQGTVQVTVKALGSNFVDLNGSYSNEFEAIKLNNVENLKADETGLLSWSFNGTAVQAYKIVMFGNAGLENYIENSSSTTNLRCEFPSVITDEEGNEFVISGGTAYMLSIKAVGGLVAGKHYLSSICMPAQFMKLSQPTNVVVQDGVLKWVRVSNAIKYEISYYWIDPVTNTESKIFTSNKQQVNPNSNGQITYVTEEMLYTSLVGGNYSKIEIKAIGGKSDNVYYLNSAIAIKENVHRLESLITENIIKELDNNNNLVFKFYPIQYPLSGGGTGVVTKYQIKTTGGSSPKLDYFEVFGNPGANDLLVYTYDSQGLATANYQITIRALAPEGSEDIINAQYSSSISITKPNTPENFVFDSTKKCFTWSKPQGAGDINITYELHYVSRTNSSMDYGAVQVQTVTNITRYYPPTLGEYKMVILASVEGCLKSDYVGANQQKFLNYNSTNLRSFILDRGVAGSNLSLFNGGLGTQEQPYEIISAEQFANMKYYASSGFYFSLSSGFTNNFGTQNAPCSYADLVGLGQEVKFAYDEGTAFGCYLEGNNKTIYVDYLPFDLLSSSTAQGLFRYTNGATISNLKFVVTSPIEISSLSNLKFGALVGNASNTKFENVSVYANILLPYESSGVGTMMYVGGIAGNSSGTTQFSNCRFEGSIVFANELSNAMYNNVNAYVGGITAQLENSATSSPFTKCVNVANLNGTIVGGIVAISDFGINECLNVGNISAIRSSSSMPQAGGLIASLTLDSRVVQIINSYNRGNVQSLLPEGPLTESNVAGILGKTTNKAGFNNVGSLTIVNTFNAGVISGNSSRCAWLLGSINNANVNLTNTYSLATGGVANMVANSGNATIVNNYCTDLVGQGRLLGMQSNVNEAIVTNANLLMLFNSPIANNVFRVIGNKVVHESINTGNLLWVNS